jgi:hypothetical protein
MKVYLSSTPEVESSEVKEVFDLLTQIVGPIEFKQLPSLSTNEIDSFVEMDGSFENIRLLSFDGLFDLCTAYRRYYFQSQGITKDDFVVVLTSIPNKHKWFSAFRGKNIFIDINDWENYTGKNQKFGIAYQVMENIFQSLLNLNIELGKVESEPNIHWHPIGCINDMCQNKRNIILKLRTADICESCQERFINLGNSIELGVHIQGEIENIRKGIVKKFLEKGDVIPKKIEVRKVGNIYKVFIEGFNNHVDFEAIARTLYVFYLKNLDGVNQFDLGKNYNELRDLYFKMRRGGDEKTLKNLTDIRDGNSFYSTVWDINKALNSLLGEGLVSFYLLKKVDDVYKISIDEKYISIDKEL